MKIPVKKGTFQISFIQCGRWYSSNLLSDGLFIESTQEGASPVITFVLDTSVNQKTKNKETSSYLDSVALAEKMDEFQYLTISDDKIISGLSSKIKNMPSKIKCMLEIILNVEGASRKFVVQPSVSGEVKLTKI
ncbi:hypothetical protein GXP67_04895 [Rhodocytophaga rosea]|uniref:Uncharacterized protein n=1 Tax=Rhodocytophaga rosea TaxID=2704465 RepID=A0A6C0GE74_9BACT|nr:hypothetical protein [Rhodocytophaga rosea]QHT66052.1 hypothetical protein GXP67_04895 [Rhodocytophaga rosea]